MPAPGVLTAGFSSSNFYPTWNFGFSTSKHTDLWTYVPGPGDMVVLAILALFSVPNAHLEPEFVIERCC